MPNLNPIRRLAHPVKEHEVTFRCSVRVTVEARTHEGAQRAAERVLEQLSGLEDVLVIPLSWVSTAEV